MQEKAAGQSMVSDVNKYTQMAMADSMENGGGAGNMAGNVAGMQMGMMMGQLQHARGRVWKLRAIHETQNVKVVIFCHISSCGDYFQVTKRH